MKFLFLIFNFSYLLRGIGMIQVMSILWDTSMKCGQYKFIFQNEFSEIQWGMSCNIESTGYKCVKCVLDTL